MSALKKFIDDYPQDKKSKRKEIDPIDTQRVRKEIEIYKKRIDELLRDPSCQKKAAQILSQLINQKK